MLQRELSALRRVARKQDERNRECRIESREFEEAEEGVAGNACESALVSIGVGGGRGSLARGLRR